MGAARVILAAVLAGFLALGCAQEPPAPAPGKAPPGRPPAPAETAGPPAPATFEAALERIERLEFDAAFAEALQAARQAQAAFPDHPRAGELEAAAARLTEAARRAVGLPYAVSKLASDDAEVVAIARWELRAAGGVGAAFLRKAVREAPESAADHAARILREMGDRAAAPVLYERLCAGAKPPLTETLLGGLAALVDASHEDLILAIYERARGAPAAEQRRLLAVLAPVFRSVCEGDPARFDALLRDGGASKWLEACVQAELGARDIAGWAVDLAPTLGTPILGLRGSYYEGTGFQRLVFERLDAAIDVPDVSALGYPGRREEDLTVRWTGFLRVAAPGRYTFYSVADDGQRLWIGGRPLIDNWQVQPPTERRAEVDLAAGLHELRLEYMQARGSGSITLSWSGPGFGREVVPAGVFRTTPWRGMGPPRRPPTE